MAEVIDIIHNLEYKTDTASLQQATAQINTQISSIEKEVALYQALQAQFNKTADNEIAKRAQLTKVIDNQRTKIEGMTKILQNQVTANVKLQQSLQTSTGQMQKFTGESGRATNAMMNLGRIVQDAPFGFLGIANNINPALESFQRLKAETGSTGGAIKALLGSLSGAAGLGFAVSIVSSLLIVFGDKMFKAGESAEEAQKKVESFKDEMKSLIDTQRAYEKLIEDSQKNGEPILKRDLENIKAKGVLNGEIFAAEKEQFEAKQIVDERELKSIRDKIALTQKFHDVAASITGEESDAQLIDVAPRLGLLDPNKANEAVQKMRDQKKKGVTIEQEYNDDITKLEITQADKVNEIAAQKTAFEAKQREAQYALSVQLQARIRANDKEYKEQKITDKEDTDRVTEKTITDRLNIEKRYQIDLINREQDQARKRGELNAENESLFGKLRAQVSRETDLKILTEKRQYYRNLKKQEEEFLSAVESLDLKSEQDKLKQQLATGQDTLKQRQEIAAATTAQQLADNSREYDAALETARKIGESTVDIDRQYQEREAIIKQQGLRAILQADEDYLKDRIALYQSYTTAAINAGLDEAALPIERLQALYGSKLINYQQYKRRKLKIDLQSNIDTAKANRAQAEQELEEQRKLLAKVTGNPASSKLDITNAQSSFAAANNKLQQANNAVIEAENAQHLNRVAHIVQAMDLYQQLAQTAVDSYRIIADAAQESLDREIDIRTERVRQAERLADRGNAEILKSEQDRLNGAIKAREAAAKREREINAALTISNALLAVAKAAAEGGGFASIATVAAVLAALGVGFAEASALSNSSNGFKKGGFTGEGDPDQPAGTVHKGEFVMTAENTKRYRPLLEAIHTGQPITKSLEGDFASKKEFKMLGGKMDQLIEATQGNYVKVNNNITHEGILNSVETALKIHRNKWS